MRLLTFFASAVLVLTSYPSFGQVHRCQDASGKITYTDRGCGSSQSGNLLENRKSDFEIFEERNRAYEAEMRKQRRYQAEREREFFDTRRPATAAGYATGSQIGHKGYAERLAERNAGVQSQLLPPATTSTQRQKPNPTSLPNSFQNCNDGFCTSNTGELYHRQGPDRLVTPSGNVCLRSGAMWQCHSR